MYARLIQWLEDHQFSCIYKKYLGIECPGCGMQRAFIELLKGNLVESIKIFPALLPMIIMFVFLALHIKFKFKKGASYLTIMFIFTTTIIVVNYIYKLIIHFN